MRAGWRSFARSSNGQLPWVNAEKAESRPDVLTSVARAFVAQSTGFPPEHLLELHSGIELSDMVKRVGLLDCAKQAWEGRKGCKKQIRNPSAEPCGWKARPVTPDQRPEVSLAWGEATCTAKRRQRVRKPCYGASKDPSREPWPFDNPGPRRGTVAVWCPRSCRRRCGTCANGQSRVPKNLGEPVVSSVEPGWSYRVTNSRPQRRTRPPRSEKNECNRGTAQRRQRSTAERAAGSHSALIVV